MVCRLDGRFCVANVRLYFLLLCGLILFLPGRRDSEQLRGGAVPRPPPQQEEQEAGARRQALAVRRGGLLVRGAGHRGHVCEA